MIELLKKLYVLVWLILACTFLSNAQVYIHTVKTGIVVLRDKPDPNATIIRSIPGDTKVEALGFVEIRYGGYFQVKYKDIVGYIYMFRFYLGEEFNEAKKLPSPIEDLFTSSGEIKTNCEIAIQQDSPKPKYPPVLVISEINLIEKSGRIKNVIEALEKAELHFIIENTGKGSAYNLCSRIKQPESNRGLNIPNNYWIGNLSSGESKKILIPITGTKELISSDNKLLIEILESNGFHSDPFEVNFQTQAFKNPIVRINDFKFTSNEGGEFKLGQVVNLMFVLQNIGQGEAKNVKIKFSLPSNIFPVGKENIEFELLEPNESKILNFEFFTNKLYVREDVPIEIELSEIYGKYGETRILLLPLKRTLTQTNTIKFEGNLGAPIKIHDVTLTSSVDRDIPENKTTHSNRYALIIGNEDYKKHQTTLRYDQNVDFAKNDAIIFREYLIKSMGFPEKQVKMVTDATKGKMSQSIDFIVKLSRLDENAVLFIYYAGHGVPDVIEKTSYLMPVDVTVSNLDDAISLNEFYSELASSNAQRIVVFLDACFSGGGRGENGLLAARSVKIKPKSEIISGNMVVFAATSEDQYSLPLRAESHGLFTYYLLRHLKDSGGKLNLNNLQKYLNNEVPKASLIENEMDQTPQILISPEIGDDWKAWSF